MNKYVFLISLEYFYAFCFILLLPKRTSGNHYQYDACAPVTCGSGPNIRFPFYVVGRQEDCGYPGFNLSCNDQGFPFIRLPENDYVIEEISYQNRILRVYNSAVSSLSSSSSCVVRLIRNTTIPAPPIPAGRIGYVNATELHLFSNCSSPLPQSLLRHRVFGCEDNLALYDEDEDLGNATETCERNVVASVERREDDESLNRMGAVVEILRRGVMMNWTASDCSTCYDSGGRCGFNQTNLHFRCFCPDRPHSRRCRPPERNRNTRIIFASGLISGVGFLVVFSVSFGLIKFLKKKKNQKRKQKHFEQNGGLLLQQEISANEGVLRKTLIFTAKQLETATNHFDESRILGQGGQGTVYKGMLSNGQIVAIKKSRLVDKHKSKHLVKQFINEVVILSQINHRNVVKLLGCCLETEVPLLVYEFMPNGTLYSLIHEQNVEFPVSWDMRLKFATEVAGALAYLHSSTSIAIFHRDIKSSNILLDEKFVAKVSDFGTSKSIAVDQTHLTTKVQGTFGYIDPEYYRSNQFTEKSDVYSFGVVLVELLTGLKPIITSTETEEAKSLISKFLSMMEEENNLESILDNQVAREGERSEVLAVANLAKRCLHLNGKERPTMKEVDMELEGIYKDKIASNDPINLPESSLYEHRPRFETFPMDHDYNSSDFGSTSFPR